MYNNDPKTFNAGAYANLPQQDIRLSGDHQPTNTQQNSGIMAAGPTGTYTQRRKQNMAYGGIAGLDGRRAYGLGSWFQEKKDKFVDDIIPNEIKENPMLTAAILGGGINQFGIPGTDQMGQGWIGDIIGGAGNMLSTGARNVGTTLGIPGADQWFTGGISPDVTGVFRPGQTAEMGGNPLRSLLDVTGVFRPGQTAAMGGNPLNPVEFAKQQGLNLIGNQLGLTSQDPEQQKRLQQQRELQRINWEVPLAVGAGAHEYQKKYLEDQPPFPGDETGIRFQTAKEAMADPELRFKPEAQYANVAEGGRIGYEEAGAVDPEYNGWKRIYEQNPGVAEMHDNHQQYLERYESEGKAQGGRIGAQEGGLMNLGGMEKDYRAEGGFVPIGGKEKADDVPARLSKNEFVFTADAVRAAGGGDIDQGAEVMENVMKNLEAGGEVSEDSQGLEGARGMFANAQQLQKRII